MAVTKTQAINELNSSPNPSNQQALVKHIIGTKAKKTIKRIIPGGKTLTEDIAVKDLPGVIYTWLRGCSYFSQVTVSFAKDPSIYSPKQIKAVDFDPKASHPRWESEGKRWLANTIASLLEADNILSVSVDRCGITTFVDGKGKFSEKSEDWEPYIEFTPSRSLR